MTRKTNWARRAATVHYAPAAVGERRLLCGSSQQRQIPRLCGDALQPAAHVGGMPPGRARRLRPHGNTHTRSVGDAVTLVHKKLACRQVLFHDGEGRAALGEAVGQLGATRRVGRKMAHDVTRASPRRARGCTARRTSTAAPAHSPSCVAGHEARAFREIPEDGIRLGQESAVIELQGGDTAVRIALQELGLAGLTLCRCRPRSTGISNRAAPAAAGPCSRCRSRDSRRGASLKYRPGWKPPRAARFFR